MIEELLLCALKRYGQSVTAARLVDVANKLVLAEALPKSMLIKSVPQAYGMLKAMASPKRGLVRSVAMTKENGREVPMWAPTEGWDSLAPLPAPSDTQREMDREQLESLTPDQTLTLFDVMREMITCKDRQVETIALAIHNAGLTFDRDAERLRARLVHAGLAEKVGLKS